MNSSRPLGKLRVLDLTQLVAGPFCTMLLGDLGADVIKVESPQGDIQRAMKVTEDDLDPPAFFSLNRNKRSLVIDLTKPDGHELFVDLVRRSDVVVENYRPGVTKRLGIDYESLQTIRPELVYATITGFGEVGPYAERPGLDLIAQGMTGLMSVTGAPNEPPAKCGVPITDLTSGLFCLIGILGAYVERLSTGAGQRVTTSLFQAGLALGIHEAAAYWSRGEVPQRLGSAHRFVAPYQALRTSDGYLTVGAASQNLWRAFCGVLKRPDLELDERFSTNPRRMANRDLLVDEIERTLADSTTAVWVERLLAAGVPSGPILTYADALTDPQTAAVKMIVELVHPQAGRIKALSTPFQLERMSGPPTKPPPRLGEHSTEVLTSFGVDHGRINQLITSGAVRQRHNDAG